MTPDRSLTVSTVACEHRFKALGTPQEVGRKAVEHLVFQHGSAWDAYYYRLCQSRNES